MIDLYEVDFISIKIWFEILDQLNLPHTTKKITIKVGDIVYEN